MKKKVILSILMISLLLVGCNSSSDKMVSKMTKFSKDISIDDDSTLNWKKYCLKSGDIACIDSAYKKDTRYVTKDIDNNGIPEIICTKIDSKGNMESEIVSFYDFEYENNEDNKNYSKDTEFDITKPGHNVIASGSFCYADASTGSGYFVVDFDGNDPSSFYKITYYTRYLTLDNGELLKTQLIRDTKTGLWSGTNMNGDTVSDLEFDSIMESYSESYIAGYSALSDYLDYSTPFSDGDWFSNDANSVAELYFTFYTASDTSDIMSLYRSSSTDYNIIYSELLNHW
jgi:hypothetical protein